MNAALQSSESRALVSTRISGRKAFLPGGRTARSGNEAPKAQEIVPNHVRHCAAGGGNSWWLYTWRRSTPLLQTRVPYYCRSWRCQHCAPGEAAVQYARIRDAFEPLSTTGVCFFVLTLDQQRERLSPVRLYEELSSRSRKFLKRLRRQLIREHGPGADFGSNWVATVEAHRSGVPHLNIIVHSEHLADALDAAKTTQRKYNDDRFACGLRPANETILCDWIGEHATESGWGRMSTGERARSPGALAGYIVKLAGEANKTADAIDRGCAGATTGEVVKLSQLPLNAPVKFRRLRAGKGFLKPRNKNPNITGTLVRRRMDELGLPEVVPLHDVSAETQEAVCHACQSEETIVTDELQTAGAYRALLRSWPAAAHEMRPLVRAVPPPPRAVPVIVPPMIDARHYVERTTRRRLGDISMLPRRGVEELLLLQC